jgi:hypothetical protein
MSRELSLYPVICLVTYLVLVNCVQIQRVISSLEIEIRPSQQQDSGLACELSSAMSGRQLFSFKLAVSPTLLV